MIEFLQAYFKYHWYLLRHRWFVFVECCKVGIPFRGLVHDLSKYLPDEFFPYMYWFYVKKNPDNVRLYEEQFHMAWLRHQKRNPHHWQWWLLTMDKGQTVRMWMPIRVRKEMLADWRGASRAITGGDNTKQWYLNNREFIKVDPITADWIEGRLGVGSEPVEES